MSLRDEERLDRRGRRARDVRLEEVERPYERRRPGIPRRSSSAGPLVVKSRHPHGHGGDYERIPREWHEHEEVHIPYRPRRRSPTVVETERERDQMYLRRPRSRHGRKTREIETEWEVEAEPRIARRTRGIPDESDEIIISRQRESRERVTGVERDEVIVRHRHERSPSMSSESSIDEPPPIRAPPIHQDVITHHRHVEHGYVAPERRRRAPDIDEIEVQRRRNHSRRRETEIAVRTSSPPRRREEEEVVVVSRDRGRRHRSLMDLREEAAYYDRMASERDSMGEAYHGATRDWTIVDVPPGTKRVTMDGIGGASQEISWQRYNGARRSRFLPSGSDEYEGTSVRRYVGSRDRRDQSWTEITKDLVIKEVIERSGYEYEETDRYYYINAPLTYDDVSSLVRSSDDFRRRRERVREIRIEASPPRRSLLPAQETSTVVINRSRPIERERIEREIITDEWGTPPRYSYVSVER